LIDEQRDPESNESSFQKRFFQTYGEKEGGIKVFYFKK
jgi:hypothetical protein